MIGSLQLFDLPFILTDGGEPADAGSTIVMYLYKNGFQFMRLGYAAAIGWVLFFHHRPGLGCTVKIAGHLP